MVSRDFFLYGDNNKWKPPYIMNTPQAKHEGVQLAKMVQNGTVICEDLTNVT